MSRPHLVSLVKILRSATDYFNQPGSAGMTKHRFRYLSLGAIHLHDSASTNEGYKFSSNWRWLLPVRKVSNRGGNTIGYFPSIKMKRQIAFESTIERDKMTLVDFDPDVQAFEEQPLVIPYQHDNKTVTYTPDLLVQTLRKCILVECKPAALVEREDNQRKFNAARKWCEEHSFEFEVVTDEQVRAGFRLVNVKRLTQYARHTISPQMKSRTYSILQAAPNPLSIEALASEIAPNNFGSALSCILHLAYYHQIAIHLDQEKISNSSVVWLPSRFATQE